MKPPTTRRTVYFRPQFYYETAADFCYHLGFNDQAIADLTGYSTSTVRRWIKNNDPPKWLLPFLYACDGYILAKYFEGWQARDKHLHAPGLRYPLTFREIQEYTFTLDVLHQYQSQHRRDLQTQKKPQSAVILQFPNNGS